MLPPSSELRRIVAEAVGDVTSRCILIWRGRVEFESDAD